MGCLPCIKLNPEVRALNECYPRPKDLIASGPEFMPLSQDTSKLTYLASNKPSSLSKIGDELEKRTVKEARGSTGGYPKSRASLLISLVILHRLLTECKRDIGLFARHAINIISASLDVRVYQKGTTDLEVASRASSCFTAFATFTDGGAIGVDDALTEGYLGVLKKFARLATHGGVSQNVQSEKKPDVEEQSRARLIGLAALHAAAGSDAVFGSNVEFLRQARIIVPALLSIISEASVEELKEEIAKIRPGEDNTASIFREFAPRKPINDRRAPSLHEHVPGEKGPGNLDVRAAALRCFHDLVGECQLGQATHVVDVVFEFFDQKGWHDVERCCWLAERLTAALLLQSRFVVPTHLVELLVNLPDDSPPTHKHTSVVAMITTILSSNISLVGLAVTDILSSLLAVIIRRVGVMSRDALLPPLVSCVASLGTHIYYADQINDIIEEIAIQIQAIPAATSHRQEILRVFIYCMIGVMARADVGDEAELRATSPTVDRLDKGKAPQFDSPTAEQRRGLGRRNPIAPEVWQETLPLLCESSFAVRHAYAQALLFFLETEIPHDTRSPKPEQGNIMRFCNTLNAAVYTLAMSSRLGMAEPIPPTPHDSPPPGAVAAGSGTSTPAGDANGKGVTFTVTEPFGKGNGSGGNGSGSGDDVNGSARPKGNGRQTPPKKPMRVSRRVSLPLNRLQSSIDLSSFDNVATPFDYSAIIKILAQVHAAVPVSALLTGAPMLLALDRDAAAELNRRAQDDSTGAWVLERKRAIRETVAFVWRAIGFRWNNGPITELSDRAIHSLSEPLIVPDWRVQLPPAEVLPIPAEPSSFYRDETQGESFSQTQPFLDPEHLVPALANDPSVQRSTLRDAPTLTHIFGAKWDVDTAIRDSVERFSAPQNTLDSHHATHTALMAIPNASYQSLGRPPSRAVDVNDLRDALGGGRDLASGAQSLVSTAPSTATPGPGSAGGPASPEKRAKPEAAEILKEIFRDRKRVSGGQGAGAGSAGAEGRMQLPPLSTSAPAGGAGPFANGSVAPQLSPLGEQPMPLGAPQLPPLGASVA